MTQATTTQQATDINGRTIQVGDRVKYFSKIADYHKYGTVMTIWEDQVILAEATQLPAARCEIVVRPS